MHAFPSAALSAELHADTHTARTAEPAAEATAWHLAGDAAPAPSLRNRLGGALIGAGLRLIQPGPLPTRIARAPHAA
ncbi:hypothetical protein AB0B01_23445 [Streptomyces sp. NPDC044571]|uniref:hypothetical protein n=1 Tax=Streptomyces sp. NPDC044571 TaxID=3155371 RepID=UPI0033EB3B5C